MPRLPIKLVPIRRAVITRVVAAAFAALGFGLAAVLPIVTAAAAQAPVGLGTAGSFAVLAGSGITNTGPTTITGDVGTHPTPSMTGFGTVTIVGSTHAADAVALQAKNDLTTAYNEAVAATPTTAVATELGGLTFTPGVYGSPTLGITGTLTLDTLGDPNAVFIFKADSTLISAANSSVIVRNGGTACNVYWQVGSSATLGTGTTFVGTVLAATSITATTGATVQGRLLAGTGAVTMDTNTITRPQCAPPLATTTTVPGSTSTTLAAALAGTSTTLAGSEAASPGGPGHPTARSSAPGTPADTTGRTSRPGIPRIPVTGIGLDLAVAGLGSLAVGAACLAGAQLRRRFIPNT